MKPLSRTDEKRDREMSFTICNGASVLKMVQHIVGSTKTNQHIVGFIKKKKGIFCNRFFTNPRNYSLTVRKACSPFKLKSV